MQHVHTATVGQNVLCVIAKQVGAKDQLPWYFIAFELRRTYKKFLSTTIAASCLQRGLLSFTFYKIYCFIRVYPIFDSLLLVLFLVFLVRFRPAASGYLIFYPIYKRLPVNLFSIQNPSQSADKQMIVCCYELRFKIS